MRASLLLLVASVHGLAFPGHPLARLRTVPVPIEEHDAIVSSEPSPEVVRGRYVAIVRTRPEHTLGAASQEPVPVSPLALATVPLAASFCLVANSLCQADVFWF